MLAVTATLSANDLLIAVDQAGGLSTAYVRVNGTDIEVADNATFTTPIYTGPAADVANIFAQGDVGNETLRILGTTNVSATLTSTAIESVIFSNAVQVTGPVDISLATGNLVTTDLDSGADISVDAAAGTLTVTGTTAATNSISLSASGSLSVAALDAGTNVIVSTDSGTLTLNGAVTAVGDANVLSDTGDIEVLNTVDAKNISITSTTSGDVTVSGVLTAGTNVLIDATNGDINLTAAATATAGSANITTAAGKLSAAATIQADTSIILTATGDLQVARVESKTKGNISIATGVGNLTTTNAVVAADGDIAILLTTGALSVGGAVTGTDISITGTSGSIASSGAVTGTGDVLISLGTGGVSLTGPVSGNTVTIKADGGALNATGDLQATGLLDVYASGNLDIAKATSTAGNVLIAADIGSLNANGNITANAGDVDISLAVGDIDILGNIEAKNVTATATDGTLTVSGDITAADAITLFGTDAVIVSGTLIYTTLSISSSGLVTYVVSSSTDAGGGSLRNALTYLVDNTIIGQATKVTFAPTVTLISLQTPLPSLTRAVTLDGEGRVRLHGGAVTSTPSYGLDFATGSDGSVVQGLSVTGFTDAGIAIRSSAVTIEDSRIGVTFGDVALANGVGIFVTGGDASIATIGTATSSNVISGNTGYGVVIEQDANAILLGNLIGLTSDGSTAVANGQGGIQLDKSGAVTIGGVGTGERNVISGNAGPGVFAGNGAALTTLFGNWIGLDSTGLLAIANTGGGIVVDGADSQAQIGGTGPGQGNVISGNTGTGVTLSGGSSGNVLEGNIIGLDASGTTVVANSGSGVLVSGNASLNTIGSLGGGNVIAGNGQYGIELMAASSQTTISANVIGVDLADNTGFGNLLDGILVDGSPSNSITNNTLSGNGRDGLRISGATALGNAVTGNRIGTSSTGASAIGNAAAGVRVLGTSGLTIGGSSPTDRNLISGNGSYGLLVATDNGIGASDTVITGNYIGTDIAGLLAIGNGSDGVRVSGVGSDATVVNANLIAGNTSAGIVIAAGASSAQLAANTIGLDVARSFAIPNGGAGVRIEGGAQHLVGGSTADANVVSGNLAEGIVLASGATDVEVSWNLIGTDGTGKAAVGNGSDGILVDASTGTTLQSNLVSGNGGSGIAVSGATSSDTLITSNVIGLDIAGLQVLPNSQHGVSVTQADETTIGGARADLGNVISGNLQSGVAISQASSTLVQSNLVGLAANGLFGRGNAENGILIASSTDTVIDSRNTVAFNGTSGSATNGHGIRVSQSAGTVIGSPSAGLSQGNTIYRNALDGVRVDTGSTGTTVVGNTIGTNATGGSGLGNAGAGIAVVASNGSVIGGQIAARSIDPVLSNVVVGNAIGIRLADSVASSLAAGNVVLGNVVRNNRGTGISLEGSTFQTVGGVAATDANVVIANAGDGIRISNVLSTGASSAGNNVIAGNAVGTDTAGANQNGNQGDGIVITGSLGNTVGGDLGSGNLVVANRHGIVLIDAVAATVADGNTVAANTTRANKGDGIRLIGSDKNTVGTSATYTTGNSAWLNAGAGIAVLAGSDDNDVSGNMLGTNALDAVLPNSNYGLTIVGGTGNAVTANVIAWNKLAGVGIFGGGGNTIGGATADLGNSIRRNVGPGVLLTNAATGNEISANSIDANSAAGVQLTNATANQIRGSNIITRNTGAGVALNSASNGNTVRGNYIGTDAGGTSRLPNAGPGITLDLSASNTLGGTGSDGNVIRFNTDNGITVSRSTSTSSGTGNSILGNSIAANGRHGILVTDSRFVRVDANTLGGGDAGDGNTASGLALGKNASQASVTGNLILANGRHGIELAGATGNTLGSLTSSGANIIGLNRNDGISVSAASNGNSLLGNSVGVLADGVSPASNARDGIAVNGSIANILRGNTVARNVGRGIAITAAAASSTATGNQVVANTISGNSLGVEVVGSSGSTVGGSAGNGNTITGNLTDGVAVTGNSSNTLVIGNAVSGHAGSGLRISESSSTLASTNEVFGNQGVGISLQTASGATTAAGNTLVSNVIRGNSAGGIRLMGSSFNTIGGTSAGNTVFSNGGIGISLTGNSSSNRLVGNKVGVDGSGAAAGNASDGIRILGGLANVISGGNIISSNVGAGVRIADSASTTAASANSLTGSTISGNVAGGVVVSGGGLHVIGGVLPGTGNVIDSNANFGVLLQTTPGATKLPGSTLQGNTIVASGGDGVRISGGGGHTLSGNSISGSAGDGLFLDGTTGNSLVGNTIGGATSTDANVNGIVLASGSSGNLLSGNAITGNEADGIAVRGVRSTDNVIGTRLVGRGSAGSGNTISGNAGVGVRITQGTRNQLGGNAIFANLGGAIALAQGGNSLQPAPVLTSATRVVTGSLVQLQVSGRVTGAARQQLVVEFFRNDATDGDPITRSGYQARIPVGKAVVTTNTAGVATFTVAISANVPVGQYITAIATSASGSTGNSSQVSALAAAVAGGAGSGLPSSRPSTGPRAPLYRRY